MSTPISEVEAVVTAIKQSKKYRAASEETIRALAVEALGQYKSARQAEKAVRKRLHSIMAPYLGDPDYAAVAARLTAATAAGDAAQLRAVCRDALYAHLSTRERLPILDDFYARIFAVTGAPHRLLDIACGLNPLALPWMGLPPGAAYYAYDIHAPRIDFINHFFRLQGLSPLARLQDVALAFPAEAGDVALFLKEMPRFARNYGELGRPLLEALRVRWLVISYPTVSTHGGRSLTARYREFMQQLVDGHAWPVTELLFDGELVFIIKKGSEGERNAQLRREV
jgi:16S rRNA (guanine(1405)-N(7))-methyltransferase